MRLKRRERNFILVSSVLSTSFLSYGIMLGILSDIWMRVAEVLLAMSVSFMVSFTLWNNYEKRKVQEEIEAWTKENPY